MGHVSTSLLPAALAAIVVLRFQTLIAGTQGCIVGGNSHRLRVKGFRSGAACGEATIFEQTRDHHHGEHDAHDGLHEVPERQLRFRHGAIVEPFGWQSHRT